LVIRRNGPCALDSLNMTNRDFFDYSHAAARLGSTQSDSLRYFQDKGELGTAAILDLLRQAVRDRQVKIFLITVYEPRPPKWVTPVVRGGRKR
jgi:hypothetical protein